MFRGIPADVSTTSTDGGVYPPMLLVVGTSCRRDPSANAYRHEAFKAFSSWFTFSNVLSPSETLNLFAMSKLDWVSFKYFATGTLRDSTVVGDGADNGKGCAEIATAVVMARTSQIVIRWQVLGWPPQISEVFETGLYHPVGIAQLRRADFPCLIWRILCAIECSQWLLCRVSR